MNKALFHGGGWGVALGGGLPLDSHDPKNSYHTMKMKFPSWTKFSHGFEMLIRKFVDSPVMMDIQKVVDMEIEWAWND